MVVVVLVDVVLAVVVEVVVVVVGVGGVGPGMVQEGRILSHFLGKGHEASPWPQFSQFSLYQAWSQVETLASSSSSKLESASLETLAGVVMVEVSTSPTLGLHSRQCIKSMYTYTIYRYMAIHEGGKLSVVVEAWLVTVSSHMSQAPAPVCAGISDLDIPERENISQISCMYVCMYVCIEGSKVITYLDL